MSKKITISTFQELKEKAEKITLLTAYDFPTGQILDEAGVEGILVGDSLANTILGYPNTIPVTMEEMLHHTAAVSRAVQNGLVIADLPFMSYQLNPEKSLENAARFIKEAGAEAIKLEGAEYLKAIKLMVKAGIPVMGHLGFTPQSVNQIGGYKIIGKTAEAAQLLKEQAKLLEDSGVFSIVLELVPAELAKEITEMLKIPTIGIGSGSFCDGQVLVLSDMLGLNKEIPKHAKVYENLREKITVAVKKYIEETKTGGNR